jgi:hypothetical protein
MEKVLQENGELVAIFITSVEKASQSQARS